MLETKLVTEKLDKLQDKADLIDCPVDTIALWGFFYNDHKHMSGPYWQNQNKDFVEIMKIRDKYAFNKINDVLDWWTGKKEYRDAKYKDEEEDCYDVPTFLRGSGEKI